MYYAILKSTVDPNHLSDQFDNIDLQVAKNEARQDYIKKYPNDNLDKTEYVTGTVH